MAKTEAWTRKEGKTAKGVDKSKPKKKASK